MRIALCLSGQARFVEQGYREVIYPYILRNNNIDIFIHTWEVPESQIGVPFLAGGVHFVGEPVSVGLINKTLDLYNPQKYKVEPQLLFPIFPWDERHMPGFYSQNAYSMFYSIYQSNKLKIEYEIENNFKYDWVIRSRFDVKLNTTINFNEYNRNIINVPNGCFDPINGYVDCFAFSNSSNMDIYSGVYNCMDEYLNNLNIKLCGEYILKQHLDTNYIPVIETVWHSLYR
jgi:hypothetical protein